MRGRDRSFCLYRFMWNAIAFLCCKRLVYYVKRWVTLSEKRVNLSKRYAIILKYVLFCS